MANFQLIAKISLQEASPQVGTPATGNINTLFFGPVPLGASGSNGTSNATDLSTAMTALEVLLTAAANSSSNWATLLAGWQVGGPTA